MNSKLGMQMDIMRSEHLTGSTQISEHIKGTEGLFEQNKEMLSNTSNNIQLILAKFKE